MGKNNKPYTYEYVYEKFNSKNYELISDVYINKNTKMKYICREHRDLGVQEVSFASLSRNKHNCKMCISINTSKNWKTSRNFNPITNEEIQNKHWDKYVNKLYDTVQDEYTLINLYKVGNNMNMTLIHNICGEKYDVEQNHFFKRNCRCQNKICVHNRRKQDHLKTTEKFKEEVFNLVGDEYDVLTEYIGNNIDVVFFHKTCGNSFYKAPHNFLRGQRCPYCSAKKSISEQYICDFLDKNDIKYIFQYRFLDLYGDSNPLKYDFYLPQYNLLIEYQGEYHDESVTLSYNSRLEKQKEYDEKKRQYAIDNNINYLEIWYWDFDSIKEIITNKLKFLGEVNPSPIFV